MSISVDAENAFDKRIPTYDKISQETMYGNEVSQSEIRNL